MSKINTRYVKLTSLKEFQPKISRVGYVQKGEEGRIFRLIIRWRIALCPSSKFRASNFKEGSP